MNGPIICRIRLCSNTVVTSIWSLKPSRRAASRYTAPIRSRVAGYFEGIQSTISRRLTQRSLWIVGALALCGSCRCGCFWTCGLYVYFVQQVARQVASSPSQSSSR